VKKYVPRRGDMVWVDFDPTAGHEQRGQRPALVLSEHQFNKVTGLALVAPVTSRVRGHGFEVVVTGKKISGAVLCQQTRTLDYAARKFKLIEALPAAVIEDALAKVRAILA
jgi:mRNA interferase MazF